MYTLRRGNFDRENVSACARYLKAAVTRDCEKSRSDAQSTFPSNPMGLGKEKQPSIKKPPRRAAERGVKMSMDRYAMEYKESAHELIQQLAGAGRTIEEALYILECARREIEVLIKKNQLERQYENLKRSGVPHPFAKPI